MSAIWTADDAAIERAAARLGTGGLVAVPTETVYGLAADAASGDAVARVFEAKGRPRFNPLILHVSGEAAARRFATFPEAAEALADRFWPGPLTLVLPLRRGARVSSLATAGLDTIALRSPRHAVARALLTKFARPFVAPSANRSGRISPTRAEHVADEFGDAVPILDGGPCEAGVESTIVGLAGEAPCLLRPGGIEASEIEDVLGGPLAPAPAGIAAPGMLTSHYAPRSAVRLEAERAEEGEVLLGFGGTVGAALDLSRDGSLREAAANLFAHLRALDGKAPVIAVAPVPERGLGVAVNDRLRRAAAPR